MIDSIRCTIDLRIRFLVDLIYTNKLAYLQEYNILYNVYNMWFY